MTSIFIWVRTGIVGVALCAAMPVLAQDLRDIPQKTDTTVSGPVTQPRSQTKQGGQMQGPPAPLETQLRDTPPDDLIVPQQQQRRPQIQAQPQIQSQTQTQPTPSRPRQATPLSQPTARSSAQQRVVPEQQVPSGRSSPSGAIASDAVTENTAPVQQDVSGVQTNPMDNVAPLLPPQITPASPMTGMDDGLVTNDNIAPTGDTPIWLWLVGGLTLLGAGAFFMRRRVATAGEGIKFGETPWRDALDKEAPAPDTTVAKPVARSLPDVKIPTASVKAAVPSARASQPSSPPPMPEAIEEPTKATANESGLIVSRMRRPVEPSPSASVMAEPMQSAPPPPQSVPPAEARVTNDGRIVSGRRASEFGGSAPAPKRKRPRKELPDGGMSFGYKVQR